MIDLTDFIKKDGRKLYGFSCKQCGEKGYRRKDHLAKSDDAYCSRKCCSDSQVTSVEVACATCGKLVIKLQSDIARSKSSDLFCGHSCSASSPSRNPKVGKNHHNYVNGNSSYRAKALRTYEHKCHNPGCLLTLQLVKIPVEMLDVDHIDDDRTNNDITNLIILCVWCHTLKTRHVIIIEP